MSKLKDITGNKYHYLTVLNQAGRNKFGQILWDCRCDCGNIITVVGTNLKRGDWKSCKPCANLRLKEKYTTYGNSRKNNGKPTPEYSSWSSMVNRCRPTSEKSHLYFDRGISVCERWSSFDNFLADMGLRPDGHTLDRINVNGNYSPENCKWSTPKQQAGNRRFPTQMEVELKALREKLRLYLEKYGPLETIDAKET